MLNREEQGENGSSAAFDKKMKYAVIAFAIIEFIVIVAAICYKIRR
ncbi:MAG: hypothetical protein WBV94_31775 [Blastocatellia bacterium]